MGKKHKILFLDIDGVLNGYSLLGLMGWNIASKLKIGNWYKKNTRKPYFGVHKEKVRRLSKIVKATDCKIVISSSWRFGLWGKTYSQLLSDEKQFIDMMDKYGITYNIIGITGRSPDDRRDKEIAEWLENNKDRVWSFVILDDEKSQLSKFEKDRLVYTRSSKFTRVAGLKHKHIRQAIKILNTEI